MAKLRGIACLLCALLIASGCSHMDRIANAPPRPAPGHHRRAQAVRGYPVVAPACCDACAPVACCPHP